MAEEGIDTEARKAKADIILERAAAQLRGMLKEAVGELVPFPPLPGSYFTFGIEVEAGSAASTDRGCVILCSDGELYEFMVGMDFSGPATDLFTARREETKKLELPPKDYIPYAYNAICEVTRLLLERQEGK